MTMPLPELLRRASNDVFVALTIADATALDALTMPLAAREPTLEIDVEGSLLALLPAIVAKTTTLGVPMRAAIEEGMTLLRPPRGFRALLPGGADELRARVRDECGLAIRSLRAVCAGDGAIADEER
ncbi:MAG: hypothetical protein ACHREM_33005, partial [Polyangiales bacterium]